MPWNTFSEWLLVIFIGLIVLGSLAAQWITLEAILEEEVGPRKRKKLFENTPKWKNILYWSTFQYVEKHKIGYVLTRWRYKLMLIETVTYPFAAWQNTTGVYLFYLISAGILGVMSILMLMCLGDEDFELYELKTEWERSLEEYQKDKTIWDEQKNGMDRKQRLEMIDKLQSDLSMWEHCTVDYFAYCFDENPEDQKLAKIAERDQSMQEIYEGFCMVDRLRKEEGAYRQTSLKKSALFPSIEPFREKYEKAKVDFEHAETQKKLEEMLEKTQLLAEDIVAKYCIHKQMGKDDVSIFAESIAEILRQTDEIELLQKTVHPPKLTQELQETYQVLYTNGLLPEERKTHFADALRDGEIHKFYDYD